MAGGTVHVQPQSSYSPDSDVALEIGAAYGPNVLYPYRGVRPGS
jgi:hypothetical protein